MSGNRERLGAVLVSDRYDEHENRGSGLLTCFASLKISPHPARGDLSPGHYVDDAFKGALFEVGPCSDNAHDGGRRTRKQKEIDSCSR